MEEIYISTVVKFDRPLKPDEAAKFTELVEAIAPDGSRTVLDKSKIYRGGVPGLTEITAEDSIQQVTLIVKDWRKIGQYQIYVAVGPRYFLSGTGAW